MNEKEQDNISKELEECKKEKEDYLNGWKREKADFVNYKKEEPEKMKSLVDYNTESIVSEILPIIDSFEMAERQIPEEEKQNKFISGLISIKIDINNLLKSQGVEELECVGKPFDPHFHEAVEMIDADGESGIIVEELVKGYTRGQKLIRPAKVKIIK